MNTNPRTYKPNADWILYLLIAVGVAIGIFGCSSSKKIIQKSESKTDSVAVHESVTDLTKTDNSVKRLDSSGITTKDKTSTYDRETVIEFEDTVVSINGNMEDYKVTGKIKKITVKTSGQILSKESQAVNKSVIDSTNKTEAFKEIKKDSTNLSKAEKSVQKDIKRKSWIADILSYWWLALIAGALYVLYRWKGKWLKGKMFGSTS